VIQKSAVRAIQKILLKMGLQKQENNSISAKTAIKDL